MVERERERAHAHAHERDRRALQRETEEPYRPTKVSYNPN